MIFYENEEMCMNELVNDENEEMCMKELSMISMK